MNLEESVRGLGAPIHRFSLTARKRSLLIGLTRQGLAIGRDVLDALLLENACRQGATAMLGTGATLGEVNDRACNLSLTGSPGIASVAAEVVIVADGLSGSFLPRSGAWGPKIASGSHFGVGARLTEEDASQLCERFEVSMHCGSAGYFGAVRLRDGTVDVAAALAPDITRRLGGPGEAVRAIACESGFGQRADLLAAASWRGTGLLTRRRRVEDQRVFVIGDAAGYVEPFTGEGMTWAMEAGLAAAPFAKAACAGQYRAGAWTKRWRRLADNRRAACRAVSTALRFPVAVACAIFIANRLPVVRERLASVISGPWGRSATEIAAV